MRAIPEVRPSPIAGTWYSNDPRQLAEQIDAFLRDARLPSIPGKVIGLIAPHAGLRYSGRTAGCAFAAVAGQERPLVAVLSPLHDYHTAALLTTAHRAYGTPLGDVPVALDVVSQVSEDLRGVGGLKPLAGDREHSLEIELPFLQRALSGPFELLPVMVRSYDLGLLEELGDAIARAAAGRDMLLVASSDLSHFYTQDQARRLDGEMLRRIEAFSPEAVLEAQPQGKGFACGAAAVAAVLFAARRLGANSVKVVDHTTSADETGDYSSVVGYGAAVVYQQEAA